MTCNAQPSGVCTAQVQLESDDVFTVSSPDFLIVSAANDLT